MKPEPGAPHELDGETRIVAVDCDRLGRQFVVQNRFGPVNWQDHGEPHHDYTAALEQAQRVMRRERISRTLTSQEPSVRRANRH